ncbi:MAG: prepilin peptidase [Phenylobacterium sp.]|nr:prepilin peptidase [Phenylobacterium sp.]
MTPSLPLLALGAVAGLALGSFAVTCGLRLARGGPVLAGRSQCDRCGAGLGAAMTLPLVSFAVLGGRSRCCGAPIDRLHLAGEAAGALVVTTALWTPAPGIMVMLAALGLFLIAASAMDARVRRLPDILTLAVAGLGLGLAALRGPAAVVEGVVAATVAVAILLGLRVASARRSGEPGLGLGDVKLIGALAIPLGTATPWAVAAAALIALPFSLRRTGPDRRMAFGPAIVIATWPVLVLLEVGAWPMTP